MDGIWSSDANRLGKGYCELDTKFRVSKYGIYNIRIKNSKPFRVSKNGVPVDSMKKINNALNNRYNNGIRIEPHRNNIALNINNNVENNISIDNNQEENI